MSECFSLQLGLFLASSTAATTHVTQDTGSYG
jgi:hypothetical protein